MDKYSQVDTANAITLVSLVKFLISKNVIDEGEFIEFMDKRATKAASEKEYPELAKSLKWITNHIQGSSQPT